MKELNSELRNGWTLRARIEQVAKPGGGGSQTLLRFSVWDAEQKQGVAIEAADAQVLLTMNARTPEKPVEAPTPTLMGGYIVSEG
jgi:hypothetical protein